MDDKTTKEMTEKAAAFAKEGNYDCAAIVTFEGQKVQFYFASGNGKLNVDDTPAILRRLIVQLEEIASDIDAGKLKKKMVMKDTIEGDEDKFRHN